MHRILFLYRTNFFRSRLTTKTNYKDGGGALKKFAVSETRTLHFHHKNNLFLLFFRDKKIIIVQT